MPDKQKSLTKPEVRNGFRKICKTIYKPAKKFIDVIDDIWQGTRVVLSARMVAKIGPFLLGGVGFLVHSMEAYDGLKKGIKAHRHPLAQRKTKAVTGFLSLAVGGAGAGVSLSYILGKAGLPVFGYAFMPVIITGLMTVLYSITLWRKAYILKMAKVAKAQALAVYEAYEEDYQEKIELAKQTILQVQAKRQAQELLIAPIRGKLYRNVDLTETEMKQLTEYYRTDVQLSNQERCLTNKISNFEAKLNAQRQILQPHHESYLNAERKIAFGIIEVIQSAVVLVGTILGTAAVIGSGTVATFGVLPLALILVGIGVGLMSNAFEIVDEKKEFQLTQHMRTWFVHTFAHLFSPKQKPKLEKTKTVNDLDQKLPYIPESTRSIDINIPKLEPIVLRNDATCPISPPPVKSLNNDLPHVTPFSIFRPAKSASLLPKNPHAVPTPAFKPFFRGIR